MTKYAEYILPKFSKFYILFPQVSMLTLSCKSSPLIDQSSKIHRSSRQSRRSSKKRDSTEYEYLKVANPFLAQEQENFIPVELLKEVAQMEYITPHLVHNISWGQVVSAPRRSSVFAKHLQEMQRAAKVQEQKSKTVIGLKKKPTVCFEEMEDQKSVSIQENEEEQHDGVSLGMHHWFEMQPQRMEHEQLFQVEDLQQEPLIMFYSQNHISDGMQDLDDYFYP